jgi:hypothetical protein
MNKLYLILAVIGGALIKLILSFNEAVKKPDYRFLIFFKQNIGPFILNIILGVALTFVDETSTLKEALFYGVGGQFIFNKMFNAFDPDVPTKLGFNG